MTKRKLAREDHKVMTHSRPHGWTLILRPRFVPNEEGAKTVRRIFEDVAGGMGCMTVAKRLQADWKKPAVPTLSRR